jgi:predicted  nucleic acid-binding Zn-ribbon protein
MSYLDDKDLAACDKCGRNYNKTKLSYYPKCGPNVLPKIDSRIPSDSSKPVDSNMNERVVLPNIDSLIRTQNRTTHAVRAFV